MLASPEETLKECEKCIGCKVCEKQCPIHFPTYSLINLYKKHNIDNVHTLIYNGHPFPIICGYICPNHFCMDKCPKKVDIKELHRHLAVSYDWEDRVDFRRNGKKVAIVGGGVAGLTCAWYLRHKGYEITLYEKTDKLGGELNLIPEERLPRDKLDKELDRLKGFIDNLYLNTEFNPDKSKDYDKVLYCIGSKPNEIDLDDVVYYDEYLKSEPKEESIAIIGGGNVALDCALHNKGDSTIFVRRNLWDMRINKQDFQTLIDRKIKVISNFRPVSVYNHNLHGDFNCNYIDMRFDKIVVAIGKEAIIPDDVRDNGIIIPIGKSVIETVANALNEIKEL